MRKTYVVVYMSLLGLLALTTGSAYLPLGIFNGVLNIGIAVMKVILIVIFFMRVRFAKKPTLIFVLAGFVWLLLLVSITMSDYLTRGAILIRGK